MNELSDVHSIGGQSKRSEPSIVSETSTEKWSNTDRIDLLSDDSFASCLKQDSQNAVDGMDCISLGSLGSDSSPAQEVRDTLTKTPACIEKSRRKRECFLSIVLEGPPPDVRSLHRVTEVRADSWRDANQRWLCQMPTPEHTEKMKNKSSSTFNRAEIEREFEIVDEESLSHLHEHLSKCLLENRLEDALNVLDLVLVVHKKRSVDLHLIAATLHNIGTIHLWNSNYDKARVSLWGAMRLRKELYGSEHTDVAVSIAKLGLAHYALGEFDQAKSLFREVLHMRRKIMTEDHIEVAKMLNNLGCCWLRLGDNNRAFGTFNEALSVFRRCVTLSPKETIYSVNASISLGNLSATYYQRKKLALAISVTEESLTIQKEMLGPQHARVLLSMENLAFAYKEAKKMEKSLRIYKEIHKMQVSQFGLESACAIGTASKMCFIYLQHNNYDSAYRCLRKVHSYQEKTLPPGHQELETTKAAMTNIELLMKDGDSQKNTEESAKEEYTKELVSLQRVLENQQAKNGSNKPAYFKAMTRMSHVHLKLGNQKESLDCMKQVLSYKQTILPDSAPELSTLRHNIKVLEGKVRSVRYTKSADESNEKDYARALQMNKAVLSAQMKKYGAGNRSTAKTLGKMTYLHIQLGNYNEAAECMKEVLAFQESSLPEGNEELDGSRKLLKKIEMLRIKEGSARDFSKG